MTINQRTNSLIEKWKDQLRSVCVKYDQYEANSDYTHTYNPYESSIDVLVTKIRNKLLAIEYGNEYWLMHRNDPVDLSVLSDIDNKVVRKLVQQSSEQIESCQAL